MEIIILVVVTVGVAWTFYVVGFNIAKKEIVKAYYFPIIKDRKELDVLIKHLKTVEVKTNYKEVQEHCIDCLEDLSSNLQLVADFFKLNGGVEEDFMERTENQAQKVSDDINRDIEYLQSKKLRNIQGL